jgi:hypothetical protein
MKDQEWYKRIEEEITGLKDRVKKLEDYTGYQCWKQNRNQETIGLAIEWPEADIGGLYFNEQKTRSIFQLKEDGNYYSRDILFISARDTDERTGRDLLSEYLESEAVRDAFLAAIENYIIQPGAGAVRVFIPEENQGVKQYNGVQSWYWIKHHSFISRDFFHIICSTGNITDLSANGIGGCAPAFRVEAL